MFNVIRLMNELKIYKGFIDQQVIEDFRWVERNLDIKFQVLAGRCWNCYEPQITIFSGFKETNCLNCGATLELNLYSMNEFVTKVKELENEEKELSGLELIKTVLGRDEELVSPEVWPEFEFNAKKRLWRRIKRALFKYIAFKVF